MACGLPAIGVRETSLSEVIEDGVTGLLCPRDDVPAFVMAAQALAGDIQRRDGMGHAAYRAANTRFSFDSMVDAYVRHYQAMHAASA